MIVGGFAILYALLDCALLLGLRNLKYRRRIRFSTEPQQLPIIAILVCARNEETNLSACLDSLLAQDYQGHWEIWVANDRSMDKTPQILKEYCDKHPQRIHSLNIDSVPSGLSPKKHAISQLVKSDRNSECGNFVAY